MRLLQSLNATECVKLCCTLALRLRNCACHEHTWIKELTTSYDLQCRSTSYDNRTVLTNQIETLMAINILCFVFKVCVWYLCVLFIDYGRCVSGKTKCIFFLEICVLVCFNATLKNQLQLIRSRLCFLWLVFTVSM